MEKIFKREDGSRVKVVAKMYLAFAAERQSWSVLVSVCAPGKRTFCGVYDSDSYTYRALSPEDKKRFVREQELQHVTKDEIYEVMLAEWKRIKPTIDQI